MSIDVKIVAVVNWGSEHTYVMLCCKCSSVITFEDCVEANCCLTCGVSVSIISPIWLYPLIVFFSDVHFPGYALLLYSPPQL